MRVYLMTDLEGVAGVMNSTDWIYPESRYYELAKELLTKEVNAAVDGFFAAGATDVVVQDGHGHGAVNIALLDSRAKLQRGWNIAGAYPFGMDHGNFDVMAYVGQHPKAGTEYGHLCHTGTFHTVDFQINGISVGEFGQGVLLSQVYGITPIFASGCLAFTKEAAALVQGIETVAVKEGIQPGSGEECTAEEYEKWNWGAIHMQPEAACKAIREGAERALLRYIADPKSFAALSVSPPYSKTVTFRKQAGQSQHTISLTDYDDLADLLNTW